MEDPEPEQKRIKRIADHIEDEIVRAQHLPLEELIRHKAFMVRLLQFLSIEEAYAVSLASRRIYEWFQQNDIWYALAQRWLTPERLAQCEAWVEQVKPKGKRINYLWLLMGEYAERFPASYIMIYNDRKKAVYYHGASVKIEYNHYNDDFVIWTEPSELSWPIYKSLSVRKQELPGKIYRYLQTHDNAYVNFAYAGVLGVFMRKKI